MLAWNFSARIDDKVCVFQFFDDAGRDITRRGHRALELPKSVNTEMLLQQFGIVIEAANELAPAEDCYAEEALFGVLRGNGVDVIGYMNVVICRRGNYISLERRIELLGLFDFSIDFSNGELRLRPIPLSLALHAGIRAILLAVNVDPMLPLPCSAVAPKQRVAPDAEKRSAQISSNLSQLGGGRSCSLLASDMRPSAKPIRMLLAFQKISFPGRPEQGIFLTMA